MSTFEYRVVSEQIQVSHDDGTLEDVTIYHLAEVEWGESGEVVDYFLLSDDEYILTSSDREELRQEMKEMLKAFDLPSLELRSVETGY